MKRDVSIIIPVYNEEASIGRVIDEVLAVNFGNKKVELIVVNDGSTDKTMAILRTHPKRKRFTVLTLKKNTGKGAAVRAGITKSLGRVVVIQDADFEYDPRELPRLIAPILLGKTSVVYGSRFRGRIYRMTRLRRLANQLLTACANLFFGTKVSDACTCYKVFSGDLVRRFDLTSRGFEVCHELTANTAARGISIKELPINYTARTTSENIKSSWYDLVIQMWAIALFRLKLWQE